ncbi:MAG: adenine deaminase [Archaeoglobaceae archaeon]|nr:adenine deaminase [Archaeoglobaceae archaeon]MCX8152176.1 adenine deaminase [Archaeoglobaceae archaeon]MDW8013892.1 adenine deaminase [Archaeoglobaceae archaeon]
MSYQICELIEVASGKRKADLVLKRAEVVNVLTEEIYKADVAFYRNKIAGVGRYSGIKEIDCSELYAVPGLIDAHCHVEMTMLSLSEFARLVVPRGCTCVVSDPHEIANVLGIEGIKVLSEEAKRNSIRFYFLAPSCVPSSKLETSGAEIGVKEIEDLFDLGAIGLAEVMNYPGVLNCEKNIIEKILISEGKILDGHCPKLRDQALNAYVSAGIMSDHESTDFEEAKEKLRLGMALMIREGSAARNLKNLKKLIPNRKVMLVTDGDRTVVDILKEGYMDYVFRRAVEEGIDELYALQAITINPAEYFRINSGLIAPGRFADVVLLKNLKKFEVEKVFVDGKEPVFEKFEYPEFVKKSVKAGKISPEKIKIERRGLAGIIEVVDGEILTNEVVDFVDGVDVERDIIKVVVVERHGKSGNISVGFVKGFGIKRGALAQTIAHDAHNIVAVGVSDEEICRAVNTLIDLQGGIVVVDGSETLSLPLRIAGLMSDENAEILAEKLLKIDKKIKELGCKLKSPVITLSFIALPVIPKLKITDLGLVDVEKFEVVDVFKSVVN